jgi:hypothetical protein
LFNRIPGSCRHMNSVAKRVTVVSTTVI